VKRINGESWLVRPEVIIIGFRNVLVHEYLEIDREIVYEILQHRLDDFEELRKVFAQFL
jgi:uncharacterized protein YutE (UPF0331/DUF86 family)